MNSYIHKLLFLFLALTFTLVACDDNNGVTIQLQGDVIMDIPAEQASVIATSGPVTNVPGDTADNNSYVFFDLDTGETVDDSLSAAWDIGFSRTNIISNYGNGGGIQVAEVSYSDVKTAPTSNYVNTTSEASASWYNYNAQTFTVEVLDNRTIFVRTPDNNYAKIEMVSYYHSETEEPRFFTFFYTLQTNGTDDLSNIVYYDIDNQELVTEPGSSQWDIAFGATTIYANVENGGGILALNAPFETVTEAPTSGYQDQNASWYTYTGQSTPPHAILPKEDLTLVLYTPDGNYAKLKILSYYQGNPDVTSESFINTQTRPASRYYTFEYELNTTGSTKFGE